MASYKGTLRSEHTGCYKTILHPNILTKIFLLLTSAVHLQNGLSYNKQEKSNIFKLTAKNLDTLANKNVVFCLPFLLCPFTLIVYVFPGLRYPKVG